MECEKQRNFMKRLLLTLSCLMPLSSYAYAETKCPDIDLIEQNIDTFSNSSEGTVTLDATTWGFEDNLLPSRIQAIKSLNTEISNIDEGTCNYLIYPMDSNLEDETLMLHQRSLKQP